MSLTSTYICSTYIQISAALSILQTKIKGQRSIIYREKKLGLFPKNITYLLIISNQCDFPKFKNTKYLKAEFIDETIVLLFLKNKDKNLFIILP